MREIALGIDAGRPMAEHHSRSLSRGLKLLPTGNGARSACKFTEDERRPNLSADKRSGCCAKAEKQCSDFDYTDLLRIPAMGSRFESFLGFRQQASRTRFGRPIRTLTKIGNSMPSKV
jgi:hypothetical protein